MRTIHRGKVNRDGEVRAGGGGGLHRNASSVKHGGSINSDISEKSVAYDVLLFPENNL